MTINFHKIELKNIIHMTIGFRDLGIRL